VGVHVRRHLQPPGPGAVCRFPEPRADMPRCAAGAVCVCHPPSQRYGGPRAGGRRGPFPPPRHFGSTQPVGVHARPGEERGADPSRQAPAGPPAPRPAGRSTVSSGSPARANRSVGVSKPLTRGPSRAHRPPLSASSEDPELSRAELSAHRRSRLLDAAARWRKKRRKPADTPPTSVERRRLRLTMCVGPGRAPPTAGPAPPTAPAVAARHTGGAVTMLGCVAAPRA
jgi:hypothetical protein